jgi:hypothetical protein
LHRFDPAIGLGGNQVSGNFAFCFGNGLHQKTDILVGVFETVKRGLEGIAQK